MLQLPKPYEDEVIGSVIARGCFQYGLPMTSFIRAIYGKSRINAPFLMTGDPHRLGMLAGISGEQLVLKHTMFPYILAFLPEQTQNMLLSNVLSGQQKDGGLSSLTRRAVTMIPYRRLCLACVKEELRKYGQAYWHRAHHLPGVYYCLKHGTRLRNTEISISHDTHKSLVALPHQVESFEISIQLAPYKLREIASISVAALNGELPPQNNWHEVHRENAKTLGYELDNGAIATLQLATDMQAFYGNTFLESAGCAIDTECRYSWPTLTVRNYHLTSLKNILMQTFARLAPRRQGEFLYKSAGLKKMDRTEHDIRLADEIRQAIKIKRMDGIRVTVRELFNLREDWNAFRDGRARFPRTWSVIKQFRSTNQSARKIGGRRRSQK